MSGAVGISGLSTSCSIRWYAYDPALAHGDGGFPPPAIEAPVPREGGLPVAPVALRYQGGTVDYRPAGSRGMTRLAFYENTAQVSPGAYVLTYGASRAQLTFGEGSLVVLHNRCTALIEDATQSGSLLYFSALERVTADLVLSARVRLPGGALIGAAPEAASAGEAPPAAVPEAEPIEPEGKEPEAKKPPKPPAAQDPSGLPPELRELLKGGIPGRKPAEERGAEGGQEGGREGGVADLGRLFAEAGAEGATPATAPPRLRFVATDFRGGRYVRVKNRGSVPLLVAHVSGDVTLGPGDCVDFPVLRGVEGADMPSPTALLASELAHGLRVRAESGAKLKVDGEVVEVEAAGAPARAWAAGAVLELEPGERLRVRPLRGATVAH